MKQTAVEWLVEQLDLKNTFELKVHEIINKSKEMEKKQIIESHGSKLRKSKGVTNYEYWYTGEDYYNETYNK